MDDQNIPSEPTEEIKTPEPTPATIFPLPLEPTDFVSTDTSPEAPESPINASSNTPAEDQNQGVNQPESEVPESTSGTDTLRPVAADKPSSEPVDVQPTSPPLTNESPSSEPIQTASTQSASDQLQSNSESIQATEAQNLPQQDQGGFIRGLLVKAQAKIQSNRQKKLDRVIQLAQKKGFISNKETQIFLHISAATATRYLSRLVKEGRLSCSGQARDLRYHFVR
jgi:hypothetical protein